MAYGLQIVNPSGELVLSSETYFPVYLGKATLSGSVVAPTTTLGGYSLYTFTYSGQILPVLKLDSTKRGTIISYSQAGSTWTIKVSFRDTSTNAQGFFTQYLAEVFVFGFPTSLGGTWGGAIYDASGNLVGDLTRAPMLVASRVSWATSGATATYSESITVPGVLGRAVDYRVRSFPHASLVDSLYEMSTFRLGTGSVIRDYDLRRRINNQAAGDAESPTERLGALDLWLIELNGLT